MVSAFASSSLGVPRWEVSVVLRLFVRDCDLLKQKGKGGWGRQGLDSRGNELRGACLEARWATPAIIRVVRPETRHSNAYTILGSLFHWQGGYWYPPFLGTEIGASHGDKFFPVNQEAQMAGVIRAA